MKNWSLLLSVFLLFSFQEKPGPITSTEVQLKAADKEFLLEYFEVTRENLEEAVRTMLAHEGPYLLEVVVEKEDNVFPMVPAGDSVGNIRLEA